MAKTPTTPITLPPIQPPEATLLRFLIPITAVKTSTNKIYAGIHWAKRKQLKDSILGYAGAFCRPNKRIGSYPVQISYHFFFGTKPLDTLNCAYMAKMFEDALRSFEILEDDDYTHVKRAIIEVTKLGQSEKPPAVLASRIEANKEDKDWLEIKIEKI